MSKAPVPRGHWYDKAAELKVGETIIVPNHSARSAMQAAAKKLGIRLVSKRAGNQPNGEIRIWRIKKKTKTW